MEENEKPKIFISETTAIFISQHGIKGFVLPTKSFVKIGITIMLCNDNKMFSSINKTFGCCSKIFGRRNKKIFVVPNFVAATKPFFFREGS